MLARFFMRSFPLDPSLHNLHFFRLRKEVGNQGSFVIFQDV